MGIPELVGDAFVGSVSMPVVVREAHTGKLELSRQMDCVRIVVSQYPVSIRAVQSQ